MRWGAFMLMALLGPAAACSAPPEPSPPPPAPPVTSAPAPSQASPPSTTTPVPESPADGTDVAACSDGVCEIEISGRTDVPLTASGVRLWRIAPDPDGVAWEVRPGDAIDQVNGGTGGRDGEVANSAAGAVRPGVGEVFAGGVIMQVVRADGSTAVVTFRRGGPTVGN